jgi:hypothetical protein
MEKDRKKGSCREKKRGRLGRERKRRERNRKG